jgi:ribosome recycling factor
LAEEGRIAVRHSRTIARDAIKKLDKVSEDDKKQADKDLQKMHDEHIAKLEEMLKAKQAEIMEV